MAEHRCGAGEHAHEVRDDDRPHKRRHEALRRVEQDDGQAEPPAVHAPHVRAADVPAPVVADVVVLHQQR